MRWRGLIVRVGLTVLVPLAAAWAGVASRQDSFVSRMAARFGLCDPQALPQVFLECKATASYLLVSVPAALALVFVLLEYEFPVQRIAEFGRRYLDAHVKPLWEDLQRRFGPNVRLNIMIAKRRWYWPFVKDFRFEFPLGFSTPRNHKDLPISLTVNQGVAGLAFRNEKAEARLLAGDDPPGDGSPTDDWRLTPKQREATKHVRWILSVPMFREGKPGEPEKASVRGVINVDATDDATARALNNAEEIGRLSETLLEVGRVASHPW